MSADLTYCSSVNAEWKVYSCDDLTLFLKMFNVISEKKNNRKKIFFHHIYFVISYNLFCLIFISISMFPLWIRIKIVFTVCAPPFGSDISINQRTNGPKSLFTCLVSLSFCVYISIVFEVLFCLSAMIFF